ncbi:hypothetical protein ACFE04_002539 [Oxalis oulophora]
MLSLISAASTTEAWNTTTGEAIHVHKKTLIHKTFFWGHETQILFSGWPGSSKGMYALALIFVFALVVIVEWLTNCEMIKHGANKVGWVFFKVGVHTVRSGIHYMVILSVVSFNGGVFLAAVGGHAVGYVLFGRRIWKDTESGCTKT